MDFEAEKTRARQKGVRAWLGELDGILRGDATRLPGIPARGRSRHRRWGWRSSLVVLGMI